MERRPCSAGRRTDGFALEVEKKHEAGMPCSAQQASHGTGSTLGDSTCSASRMLDPTYEYDLVCWSWWPQGATIIQILKTQSA